jgi:hypothetical protein
VRLVRITMIAAAGTTCRPAPLTDAVWLAVRPGDGVEHVSVRCESGRTAIGLFLRRGSGSALLSALVERISGSPLLRGWEIESIRGASISELLPPGGDISRESN